MADDGCPHDPNIGENCNRCGNWTATVFRVRLSAPGLCSDCYHRLYHTDYCELILAMPTSPARVPSMRLYDADGNELEHFSIGMTIPQAVFLDLAIDQFQSRYLQPAFVALRNRASEAFAKTP